MAFTMLLILALYVVFIGALWYAGAGTFTIVVVMGLFMIGQFFFSDKLALHTMGAYEVSEEEYPELHASIARLSQQADIPKPKVAVADMRVPNAFATGRSQDSSTICVTRGIMNTLTQEELEGVLAHELTHVKNRDVMVMTIASFLSTLAFFVVEWGWLFMGDDEEGAGALIAILASLVVGIVSFFLIRALSRYREYSADRGGAIITGNPGALASALMKISGRMDKIPEQDLRDQSEMNAFFIIPLDGGGIKQLLSTHPDTEKRIERLRDMEQEMAVA